MDTTYLRTFQRVIETASFSAAARELGYAQSTVTGHIKLLERLMGRRLIDRQPTGAVPTEAGLRLLRHAESMLRQEQEMLREVRESQWRSSALHLAAPESLSCYRLPPVLASLARDERAVNVTLTTAGTAAALAAVRRGAVDAALVIETNLAADDLLVTRLGEEPVHLLSGRSEEPRPDRPLYLLLEPGCCYSDDLAEQLAISGTPSTRIVRMNSIEAVKRCCAAGMGSTVLPAVTVEEELARGDLQVVDGPEVRAVSCYLVRHPASAPTRAASRLFASLRTLWQTPTSLRGVG